MFFGHNHQTHSRDALLLLLPTSKLVALCACDHAIMRPSTPFHDSQPACGKHALSLSYLGWPLQVQYRGAGTTGSI